MKSDLSHTVPEGRKCQCDNCGHVCTADELNEIEDLEQRIGAGNVIPAGDCPKCGCLSFMLPDPWANDRIQFARLLAELCATYTFTPEVMCELREYMAMDNKQINALLDRAETVWQQAKKEI